MAIIVIFDPNASPNKIVSVDYSGSTDQFTGRADALINPSLGAVAQIAPIYWKHVSGGVVEMTAQEKSDVDAGMVANALALMRTGGKAMINAKDDIGILQRALADILRDEINVLRQWLAAFKVETAAATNLANFQSRVASLPATPDRTLAQLRTALATRIDSGNVDS